MKLRFIKPLAVFLIFTLIFPTICYADVSETPSYVTEYYSEDQLENFELDDSVPTAATSESKLSLTAKSAILIERSTGKVLFENNADEKLPPASITKIMSLLLVVEAIDQGKIKLEDTVSCSDHASSMGGSQIWLKPGETMTVDELLKAAAVGSANDATCALGEFVAGSEEGFVEMMNNRAAELGMKNTKFQNCTGLDADDHYSSARDIVTMSRELIGHDIIKNYSTIWMDSLRNGQTQLVNTNKLVRFYEGTTGLKTGTTDGAGHCLSATATRNGLDLIAVVLGCPSGNERFSDAKKLLNYGFANWGYATAKVDEKELQPITVTKGIKPYVNISPKSTASFLVTKGTEKSLEIKLNLPESIEAPVTQGETIGKAVVSIGDKKLGEIDIVANENVDEMTFGAGLIRMLSALFVL